MRWSKDEEYAQDENVKDWRRLVIIQAGQIDEVTFVPTPL